MSSKAAVGALVGGLGGATLAIIGRAFFSRQRHVEAFDAITSAGILVGGVIGAAVGDSFGVVQEQPSAAITTTTPTTG
jgi:hypothetical protein